MTYIPVTPFRRAVDAAILKHQAAATQDLPPTGVNKWEVLRELGAARVVFKLSDRDIAVLQALVSFHSATILGGNDDDLIVYPSNAAICERLNGMPNSTMRRHLARLVQAGVVVRRDSPNGKRYVRRAGGEKVAFGFDLTPLVLRHAEFCRVAEAVREAAERHKRLRETVSLMRRDLASLAAYGAEQRPDLTLWDAFADLATLTARDLRRKLDMDVLATLECKLQAALDQARNVLDPQVTEEMNTSESRSEQHLQNSNKDSYDLEPCLEKARGGEVSDDTSSDGTSETDEPSSDLGDGRLPNIPLGLVLASCREYQTYCDRPVRHWHELVRVADVVRPMMGISPSAWDNAKRHMGPEEAAVVVIAMLERFSEIRSPGGYLRALTDKAAAGAFSCGPMVMALMNRDAA